MDKTIYTDEAMLSTVVADGERSSSIVYTVDGISIKVGI